MGAKGTPAVSTHARCSSSFAWLQYAQGWLTRVLRREHRRLKRSERFRNEGPVEIQILETRVLLTGTVWESDALNSIVVSQEVADDTFMLYLNRQATAVSSAVVEPQLPLPTAGVSELRTVVQNQAGRFDIVLHFGPQISANAAAMAAFERAALFWETQFADPITVDLDVEFGTQDITGAVFPANVLGSTQSEYNSFQYSDIRDALILDASKDEALVNSLPSVGGLTFNSPAGISAYQIAGQTQIDVTRANALAMGFTNLSGSMSVIAPGVIIDGSISFNSNFPFDLDKSNGVSSGSYDFEGVALHEIGHALGFVSANDIVDYFVEQGLTGTVAPNPMDLFRLAPGQGASFATAPRILNTGAAFPTQVFYDGRFNVSAFTGRPGVSGLTTGDIPMSTGQNEGDGNQASHFKADDLTGVNIGIMDPTLSSGVIAPVTRSDLRVLGMIGWDWQDNGLLGTAMPTITVTSATTSDTTPTLSGTVSEAGADVYVTLPSVFSNDAATLLVSGGLGGTNAGSGSFTLSNSISSLANITRLDLILPTDANHNYLLTDSDNGDFIALSGAAATGLLTPQSDNRFNDQDVRTQTELLSLTFSDFDPGESFSWDVYVFNSTLGTFASGNDLIGALARITYSNGITVTNTLGAVSGNSTAAGITLTTPHYLAATNNGSTWTLADNVLPPLTVGQTYEVQALIVDSSGARATDTSSNELVIQNSGSISVSIATVTNGAETNTPTNGLFRVTMTASSLTNTVVNYSVAGTATAGTGNDYATLSGSVTILAGQLTADIPVVVLNDTIVESTETVVVTLTGLAAHASNITLNAAPASRAATINITDDDPLLITSTNTASVSENILPATPLIIVTANNPPASTLTLTLSGPDAALFRINSGTGQLTFLASPNFESPLDLGRNNRYDVTVNASDDSSPVHSTSQNLVITVTNLNETPTRLALSGDTISENQPAGSTIGSLSTSDPDIGDSFTYSLTSGTGGADNDDFQITGNQLRTTQPLNFEAQSTYFIRVRTTDSGNLTFENTFIVTITDINESPTDLTLSAVTIPENLPVGTSIGTLSSSDPDQGDSFTYSLVSGAGSVDNSSFQVIGNTLLTAQSLDFEVQANYLIRIRTTDLAGLTFENSFTITVTDINEAPTDLLLFPATVAENQPAGTPVGTLTGADQDLAESLSYSLVAGTDSNDNAYFQIAGDSLQTSQPLDFDTQATYSLLIRTTDHGGLKFDKLITVAATNINEAPTSIALSASTIAENQPADTPIGLLSSTDPDAGSIFSYSLVSDADSSDNDFFRIDGDILRTAQPLDFETQATYSIHLRTTDNSGLTFDKTFTVSITNLNEPPVDLTLSAMTAAENLPAGSFIGDLSSTDPDSDETFSYSLISREEGSDNAFFQIVGNTLSNAEVLNFEAQAFYTIRLRTTDRGGLTFDQTFLVTVTNVNEAPVDLTLSNMLIAENQSAGAAVGTLAGTDPDADSTLAYTLVSGDGDTGNAAFAISGSSLITSQVLDFETQSRYAVRVRATDTGGLSTEQTFNIEVTDNEDPPDVTLSSSSGSLASGRRVPVDPGLTVFDQDSTNLNRNRIVITIQPGTLQTGDRLRLIPVGTGTDRLHVSQDRLLLGNAQLGTATGGREGQPLVIFLTSDIDAAQVQRVLRQVGLKTRKPAAGTRLIQYQIFDETGTSRAPVIRNIRIEN